jgi:hypothetical protein
VQAVTAIHADVAHCWQLVAWFWNTWPTIHLTPNPDNLQDDASFSSVGVLAPASITGTAADLVFINGYDGALTDAAATIQAFVAAGGGIIVGNHGACAGRYAGSNSPVVDRPCPGVPIPLCVAC